jgi:hypothetical protein
MDLGVDQVAIARELEAMSEIAFARTASRSVLGTMNEHAFHLHLLREARPTMTEHELSVGLGDTLVTIPGHGYQIPAEFTAEILGATGTGSRP